MLLLALENTLFAHMEPTEILVDNHIFSDYRSKKWMIDETSVFGLGVAETRKWPNIIFRACTKGQREIPAVFVVCCFLNLLRQTLQKLPANLKLRYRLHMEYPRTLS